MPFAINSQFGIGFGREVLVVYGPNTTAAGVVIAGEWRAASIGASSRGAPPNSLVVRDAELGLSLFQFDAPGAPPVGAPPIGSLVRLQLSPAAFALGVPISTFPKTIPAGPLGVVFAYQAITSLGGATFAVVILEDGSLFTALPEELSMA